MLMMHDDDVSCFSDALTLGVLHPYELTLSNGGDGLSKAVGNQPSKEKLTYGAHRPVGL
jgi:hypothetical protein